MKKNTSQPKVTSVEVAALAGVSRWTVSRTFTPGKPISEEARVRVLDAAKQLGYKPNLLARSLSTQKTGLIAVVVDTFQNYNVMKLLDQLSFALQKNGLRALLINVADEDSVADLVEHADQLQTDGVIFLGATLTGDFVSLASNIKRIPLVIVFRDCDLPEPLVLNTDDYAAGFDIATLLVGEGAKQFAYFSGPTGMTTRVNRREGYEDGLHQLGFDLSVLLNVTNYDQFMACDVFAGYLNTTPKHERVDAIFCENDAVAFGVIDAMRAHGCLGSIAVVGFDDIAYGASPSYQLTSYAPPVSALIDLAVQAMLRNDVARTVLKGQLVLRESHKIIAR
ncbi:LacI family DNA-binding transcriptional regulator [Marinomonas sp. IMCC 4694]|uniref:LacI family DNA-binding transcriptional regulator n=1 Tax=Marinomonas sp. IMCC 4694 TaxID=2605432 RepID=UPI0011E77782|nr:LacI family DNA-binding transcriptional regulator [Marinomonas sp. IMCC 4694]TYL48745.1 LacI family transcriptional regulator [Marinomonas sp. IMCC 4694]